MSNDSKYKRLYPERAVAPLLEAVKEVLGGFPDPPMGGAQAELMRTYRAIDELSFPPDEPLFLLRGQDELAPVTVRFYADIIRHTPGAFGVGDQPQATIDHLKDFADLMEAWEPRKLPD